MADAPDRQAIYEPIDHTADAGMWVYGRDHADLFAHAAWALFDMMGDAETIRPQQSLTIRIDDAADWEDLLVRWLSELLYRYDTERFLCGAATFTALSPTGLTAQAQGEYSIRQDTPSTLKLKPSPTIKSSWSHAMRAGAPLHFRCVNEIYVSFNSASPRPSIAIVAASPAFIGFRSVNVPVKMSIPALSGSPCQLSDWPTTPGRRGDAP